MEFNKNFLNENSRDENFDNDWYYQRFIMSMPHKGTVIS